MNTLSQRIKFAKRELTNLKTAHRRGLGLLKVYYKPYTVPPPTDISYAFIRLDLTVNFDGIAYPLIGFLGRSTDPTAAWSGSLLGSTPEIQFTNGGHTAKMSVAAKAEAQGLYRLYIYATSPVKSISYNWVNI